MKDSYYKKVELKQHGIYLFVGFDMENQQPFWSMGMDTADSEMKIRVLGKDAKEKLQEMRKLIDDAITFIDVESQKPNDTKGKSDDGNKK